LAPGVLVLLTMAPIAAADITGKWTSSFDMQIGKQEYTYDFVVKGSTLTGKMKSNLGESDVLDGKVDGDKVSFGAAEVPGDGDQGHLHRHDCFGR
jgi:hypothetical protein